MSAQTVNRLAPSTLAPPPATARFVSVGTKLALTTTIVVLVVSWILYVTLTRHDARALLAAKREAAQMVVDLFAESVSAPLDFDDAQAVKDEITHLSTNREVLYAAVWHDGEAAPIAELARDAAGEIAPPRPDAPGGVEERADRLVLTHPVRNVSGAHTGSIVVHFSLAAVNESFAASKRRILLLSGGLALGLIVALLTIARRAIVRPLERLAHAARRLEAGAGSAKVDGLANDEVGRLGAAFNRMARAIVDREERVASALQALREKDALLSEDIEQARAFQQKLLPQVPASAALAFAAVYDPADRVGGDIYDLVEITPGIYRVFMADTTGHGVQASLRTIALRTEYDSLKRSDDGPGRVLERLNAKLVASYPNLELRCSAVCFDVKALPDGTARVRYAMAAQPPLLHASATGVAEVYQRGAFLGMTEEVTLDEGELTLAPGDRLLAYSDGIFEQESPEGAPFGLEPVMSATADRSAAVDAIVTRLAADVRRFAGKEQLDDDLTLLAVECRAT